MNIYKPPTGDQLDRLYHAAAQYRVVVEELFRMRPGGALHTRDTTKDDEAYKAFVNLNNAGQELDAAVVSCLSGKEGVL